MFLSKRIYAKYCCNYFPFVLFALIDNIHTFHIHTNEFTEDFGLENGPISYRQHFQSVKCVVFLTQSHLQVRRKELF